MTDLMMPHGRPARRADTVEIRCEDHRMDVLALVFSALSLGVALIGTYLANKRAKEAVAASERSAQEAIAAAERSTIDSLWSAAQEPVQRLIGFDPSAAPVNDRLENLRIAMIALVDGLPTWDGLDQWLDAERMLGATYARTVMDRSRPDDSVDQRVDNLMPLMTWAQTLSSNLRYLRSTGHDAGALNKLTQHAASMIRQLHNEHGWALPSEHGPGVAPLD